MNIKEQCVGSIYYKLTGDSGEIIDQSGEQPLSSAGMVLKFDVDVVAVREVTEEELAHGHSHSDGGHQH
ncbi:MAG: hypothetical protein JEZ04_03930 [Spirochaetales bacterium]|nr:hypothetical protein [Spirochaetales bacterium]